MYGNKYSPAFEDLFLKLLCLLLIPTFFFRLTNGNCSHEFFFTNNRPANSGEQRQPNISWELLDDTKQCDDELSTLFSYRNFSDPHLQQQKELEQLPVVSPCVDGLLDIELNPISVFPVGKNILPYVQLNISIKTFSVDQLFFRFRCIYAPNTDDYLCHNHSIQQLKWGRMIWPCRKLRIEQKQQIADDLLFHFSYTCFRLFSLSQYSIDFFVLNGNEFCRRELIFTIPMEQQLDPKIAHIYKPAEGTTRAAARWSPLVALDTSFSDSLLVQLHPSEWLMQSQQNRPATVSVAVYYSTLDDKANDQKEVNDNDQGQYNPTAVEGGHPRRITALQKITAEEDHRPNNLLPSPKRAHQQRRHFLLSQKVPFLGRNDNVKKNNYYRWTWKDVEAGNYTLFAFVDQGDCQLTCRPGDSDSDNKQNGPPKCQICLHTTLNFTLTVAKHSEEWHRSMLMTALVQNANFCVLGILSFLLISLIVAFLYVRIWRPRVFARLPCRSVELGGCCPTVLVLYTDDCPPYSDAVLALCRTLEQSANAKCLLDQWEFVANPTLRPSLWLVNTLAECDFVLVIFSACSARVMAGEQLVQRRHFPDLFNSGLGFVVARIREIASSEGVILPQLHHQQRRHNGHMHQSQANCANPINISHGNCHGIPSTKSLLNRFIFARFAGSDPSVIPPFFTSSQFGVGRGGPLVLPDQIGLLIARLHGVVDATEANGQRFLHEADLGQLNDALEKLRQFVETNPNWMDDRFVKNTDKEQFEVAKREKDGNGSGGKEEGSSCTTVGGDHALMFNALLTKAQQSDDTNDSSQQQIRVPTVEEQAQIAERYGLLAVEEEEEEEDENGKRETKGQNRKSYQLMLLEDGDEEEEEHNDDEEGGWDVP